MKACASSHSHGCHSHSASESTLHTSTDWSRLLQTDSAVSHVAFLGLFVNVLLSVLKLSAGTWFQSTSIQADASHAVSDTVGDILMLFCLGKARAKPTAAYPLGSGKMETFGSFGISLMLLCSSLGIGSQALSQLWGYVSSSSLPGNKHLTVFMSHVHHHDHHSVPLDALGIAFLIFNIAVKELMYRIAIRTAHRTRSSVLEVRD